MFSHPAVKKVMRRMRAQQRAVFGLLAGLGLLVLGGCVVGVGQGVLQSQWVPIVGVVLFLLGVLTIAVAIGAYLVIGLMVRSAVRAMPDEAAESEPLVVGEKVGRLVVLAADEETLHLSLACSPFVAGAYRFAGCVALLLVGIGAISLNFMGKNISGGAFALGLGALVGVGVLASLPYSMQWIAGPLEGGGRGFTIERVRWFFVRDVFTIGDDEIASLIVDDSSLVIKTTSGALVSLARTGSPNILNRWRLDRTVISLVRVLGHRVVEEQRAMATSGAISENRRER